MPLQVRGADGQVYSPQRDLRQCYPEIVKNVSQRFNNESWPELVDAVERAGGSWDGLCNAMTSIAVFLSSPISDPSASMETAMRDAGWFKVTDADRVGICAMFGSVMLGQLHHAIRESTPLGAWPADMMGIAEGVSKLLLRKPADA